MRKPAAIAILFVLLVSCNTIESTPREFIEENRSLLDSCNTYILENSDTLLGCRVLENATVVSIYPLDRMQQCEFVKQSEMLQRLLTTEIDFISLGQDSTIIYFIEGSDQQSNRFMIVYSRSQSPEELKSWHSFQELPKRIEGYYYEAADNISIAN